MSGLANWTPETIKDCSSVQKARSRSVASTNRGDNELLLVTASSSASHHACGRGGGVRGVPACVTIGVSSASPPTRRGIVLHRHVRGRGTSEKVLHILPSWRPQILNLQMFEALSA